jgi:hypothetical protein
MTEEKRAPDKFGIGMLDNGTLNIVSQEEHAKRVAERNAEEEGDDDLSDLSEVEEAAKVK